MIRGPRGFQMQTGFDEDPRITADRGKHWANTRFRKPGHGSPGLVSVPMATRRQVADGGPGLHAPGLTRANITRVFGRNR